jgi:hypothetical protein
MWVGSTGRSRENVSRTGFRLSLLCFQEAAPRQPHRAACRSDTRSHFRRLTRSSRRRPDPKARALESGEKTLVSTGPVVPGPLNGRDPACGARRETSDSRAAIANTSHNRANPLVRGLQIQAWPASPVLARSRAHFRFPFWIARPSRSAAVYSASSVTRTPSILTAPCLI